MEPIDIALTESETARLLNLSVSGLRKWRRNGSGPRYVRLGRLIRYRVADIQVWLDCHAVADSLDHHENAA